MSWFKYIEENQPRIFFFEIEIIKVFFKDFVQIILIKFVALSNASLQEWNVKNGVVIPNPFWFEMNKRLFKS